MVNRIAAWRPPTGVEMCGCIECHTCDPRQSIWSRYRWWSLIHWLPRYLWCLAFGHLNTYNLVGSKWEKVEASTCRRCSCYMRMCANCDRDITDHVGQRCLYGPGKFTS